MRTYLRAGTVLRGKSWKIFSRAGTVHHPQRSGAVRLNALRDVTLFQSRMSNKSIFANEHFVISSTIVCSLVMFKQCSYDYNSVEEKAATSISRLIMVVGLDDKK